MLLPGAAERAQDIANVLGKFRDHDPDDIQNITDAIAGLIDLSRGLRRLKSIIEDNGGRLRSESADDLHLLEESVACTLQDVWIVLGRMPERATNLDYRITWREIRSLCRGPDRQSFEDRLDLYMRFINALCRVLQREPPRRYQIEDVRPDIIDLRRCQLEERRLITATEAMEDLSLVPAPRPARPRPPDRDSYRLPNRDPRQDTRRPMSPTASDDSWEPLRRQNVPSPPQSPITIFSSTISQTSSGDIESTHWANSIFTGLSSTPLEATDHVSKCYEDDREYRTWPGADYSQILKLRFPGPFKVHLFHRDRDYRAKILCEWPDGRKRNRFSCRPLSDLHLNREGPVLYLCRPSGGRRQSPWVALEFRSIEWLIVFHCTVVSLRSHDLNSRVDNIHDYELRDETSILAAPIRDGIYRHALRMYRDRHSSAIRIQASVMTGEMDRAPIWTAFITHLITSPTWCRRDRSTVFLRELRRHVFSAEYKPDIAPSGEHMLQFELTDDAIVFARTVEDFGREYRRL